jgi:hypothetical protein
MQQYPYWRLRYVRLRIVIALILTTLIVGGCEVSNGDGSNQSSGKGKQNEVESKPDVAAFNDPFTEEFLTSTKPVRDGYYPLKAKTGAFTLDFPEDMVMDDTGYSKDSDGGSEVIIFYHPDNDRDLVWSITLEYYAFMVDEEISKKSMSGRFSEELQFESLESEVEGQKIEFAEAKSGKVDGVTGLVWNDNNQQIQFYATWNCKDGLSGEECAKIADSETSGIKTIIESIKFDTNKSE